MANIKDEIAALSRQAKTGLVTVEAAALAWGKPRPATTRRLSALERAGWLRRLQRGTYEILPLEGTSSVPASYDDPWTLAQTLFEPCYIGGWSAAEHWGLTEQLFHETFVVTAAHVRSTRAMVGGLAFRLVRVSPERARGDTDVWRQSIRVSCSSPEQTLVDAANNPSWVGGVRHLAEVMARYAELQTRNVADLAALVTRIGRGAGAKRLGFIAEQLAEVESDGVTRDVLMSIRNLALPHVKTGVVRLDPAVRSRGRMNTGWGLWINSRVVRRDYA